MNILCSTDDAYVTFCGIMLTSLFENNKDSGISVYVLTEEISSSNEEKLCRLASKYGQRLIILRVTRNKFDKCPIRPGDHISLATYFRLAVTELLPKVVNKVIYLDCDIIVDGSLRELWETDINEYPIGACVDEAYWDFEKYQRLELSMDTPYFNAEAFREAWFNAVCHNLWVEKVPPAIYGFDDRVEIISYGLLKDGMTKEEFFMGISNPVNEEFAKIFMQLHYMEQSGKGVPTVVAKYGKEVYHFGTSFIQCILPYNIIDKQKQKRLLGRNDLDGTINGTIKLSKTATIIYEFMKKDVKVTKSQLSQKAGKSIRTVSCAIDELKNNGLLLGRTSNKNGEWILKK